MTTTDDVRTTRPVTAPWRPIITGPDADRVHAAVADIAAALRGVDHRSDTLAPWLASGTTGIAAFFAAYAEATGDDDARAYALLLVEDAIENLGQAEVLLPDLYGGISGVGWALSRLEGRLLDRDDDESDVDAFVTHALEANDPWPGSFDLIRGLAGIGTYALERLPRASARHQIELVVDRLAGLVEAVAGQPGHTWRTQPSPLFPATSNRYPNGHFDVGLAHGVAGPIAFLAEVLLRVPDAPADTKPLLEGALRWLRTQRLSGARSVYPSMYGPDDDSRAPARLAWCYGDPGVAVALLAAGRALGDETLVAEARELAYRCAGVGAVEGHIEDAGLCHGSAGLGHVLNCLGQGLGDEHVLDLARHWFAYTLDHRTDEALAGFPTLHRRIGAGYDGTPTRDPDPGILEGAAGVGLALLSTVSDVAPWWDGLLLTRFGAS